MSKIYFKFLCLTYFSVFFLMAVLFGGFVVIWDIKNLSYALLLKSFCLGSFITTAAVFFGSLSDFLVKLNDTGVCKGIFKDCLKWSQIISVEVVDFFNVKYTKKIKLTSADKVVELKLFVFSSEEEVFNCIKKNLPWVPQLNNSKCPVEIKKG